MLTVWRRTSYSSGTEWMILYDDCIDSSRLKYRVVVVILVTFSPVRTVLTPTPDCMSLWAIVLKMLRQAKTLLLTVYASVLELVPKPRAITEVGLPPVPKRFISPQDDSWHAQSNSALSTYHLHWLLLCSIVNYLPCTNYSKSSGGWCQFLSLWVPNRPQMMVFEQIGIIALFLHAEGRLP